MEQDIKSLKDFPKEYLEGFLIGKTIKDKTIVYENLIAAVFECDHSLSEYSCHFVDGLFLGLKEDE